MPFFAKKFDLVVCGMHEHNNEHFRTSFCIFNRGNVWNTLLFINYIIESKNDGCMTRYIFNVTHLNYNMLPYWTFKCFSYVNWKYNSTYINTKMSICLSVCLSGFSRHLESDWDTLWHKFAFRPRMSSKTVQFPKSYFYCRFSILYQNRYMYESITVDVGLS